MNYQNKSLRDLSKGAPCMAQLPGICNSDPATTVWAHSNQQRHGHGKGIKSHDPFGAICCSACHYEIDQGKTLDRWQRQDAWTLAFERTLLWLWQSGKIGVVSEGQPAIRKARAAPERAGSRLSSNKVLAHKGTL